jgi:hypothetical protein
MAFVKNDRRTQNYVTQENARLDVPQKSLNQYIGPIKQELSLIPVESLFNIDERGFRDREERKPCCVRTRAVFYWPVLRPFRTDWTCDDMPRPTSLRNWKRSVSREIQATETGKIDESSRSQRTTILSFQSRLESARRVLATLPVFSLSRNSMDAGERS